MAKHYRLSDTKKSNYSMSFTREMGNSVTIAEYQKMNSIKYGVGLSMVGL